MKEPAFKLPWIKGVDLNNRALVLTEPKEGVRQMEVVGDVWHQDAEYIIQACNLFPEAVELLEKLLDVTLEHNELALAYKIEEFLTKLENDSTGE